MKTPAAPSRIVCAVRGQPESRRTVARAIELALTHEAALTFIHVIDAEFLAYATVGIPRLMYRELRSLGEFVMHILRERAENMAVRQVDTALLEGRVPEEIVRFLQEHPADLLVLGLPARDSLSPQDFRSLVQQVEALGIRVELAA